MRATSPTKATDQGEARPDAMTVGTPLGALVASTDGLGLPDADAGALVAVDVGSWGGETGPAVPDELPLHAAKTMLAANAAERT